MHPTPLARPLTLAITAAISLLAVPQAQAIETATATSQFDAVGELSGMSGVLIADHWVLTAAHVAGGITVGSTAFVSDGVQAVIDQVVVNPDASFPGNDLALAHLSTSLAGVAAPTLYDTVLTNATAHGTVTLASAQNQTPNGTATASLWNTMPVYTDTSTGVSYQTNWVLTSGAAAVQSGDSGGGLFLGEVADSTGATLLGIASSRLTSGGNTYSAWVQVAAYKPWIDTVVATTGDSVLWYSAVPEAPGLALALCGVLPLLLRRWR